MVNTFIVDFDFKKSASLIDSLRLGKQRSECKIIINVIQDLKFLASSYKIEYDEKDTLGTYINKIKKFYLSLDYAYIRVSKFYIKCDKKDERRFKLGYCSHPGTKMWFYNLNSLKEYTNSIIEEWVKRGKENKMALYKIKGEAIKPGWLNKDFILRHQSNLKRKDKDYYKFDVPDDLGYIWPY